MKLDKQNEQIKIVTEHLQKALDEAGKVLAERYKTMRGIFTQFGEPEVTDQLYTHWLHEIFEKIKKDTELHIDENGKCWIRNKSNYGDELRKLRRKD